MVKTHNHLRICCFCWVGVMATILVATIQALPQENPEAPQSGDTPQAKPSPKDATTAGSDTPASLDDTPASLSEGERFRLIGSAQLLGRRPPGTIGIGPLYLSSVDVLGAYDDLEGQAGKSIIRAGILTTTIVFDKQLGAHNRFALQYQPQIFGINGDFESDFVGHSASLSGFYTLTPRWTLSIYDKYAYLSNIQQRLQSLTGLSFDTHTGYTASNRFLLSPGNFVTNTTGMSLSYAAGERTTITLTPIANYAYTNQPGGLTGLQYGGAVGISHQVSESRTVMASYTAQKAEYSQQLTNTWYHTMSIGFSQAFGPTAFLSLSGQANSTMGGGSTHWTGGAAVSFTKSFGRTAFAASYARSNQFLSTLQNGFGDQVQASLSRQFTQKFQATIAGGLYNALWTPQGAKSHFGSAILSYQLLASLYATASYSLRSQSGDSTVLLIGRQNLASVGLQWIPGGRQLNNPQQ